MSIGIALAGGGLKGVAHIGAIKALQELGLQIDYITGTSSGAMMAALYALGYTPEEMKKITKESYKEIIKFKKRVTIIIALVLQMICSLLWILIIHLFRSAISWLEFMMILQMITTITILLLLCENRGI